MNCLIYIVSHKNFNPPQKKYYMPIFVGPNKIEYGGEYVTDKTKIQISEKNPNYCELTALYWIWKNVHNIDYVGLVHYRRLFYRNCLSKSYSHLISETRLEKYMKDYDMILPYKNYSTLSIRKEYTQDGSGLDKDLDLLQTVISDLYPEYLDDYITVLNGHQSYLYNMFFCKKELMDQYCEWLFAILSEVENRIDISQYNRQQARVFGYMAERLMSVYVLHNQLKIKELPVFNIENKFSSEICREIKRRIKKVKYK